MNIFKKTKVDTTISNATTVIPSTTSTQSIQNMTYGVGNMTGTTTYVPSLGLGGTNVTFNYPTGTYVGAGSTWIPNFPQNIISFNDSTGKEIVKLTKDGEVIWNDNVDIDSAAEAFSRTLNMGAEIKAGMIDKVKRNIRDTVFSEIIAIAKEKGTLSAEELTLMLESTKIMEKLKGL